MTAPPAKSGLFSYLVALACGALAGVAHIGIEDPLITALIVLASTMVLGYIRPSRPWLWILLVGIMVPIVMITARLMGRYAGFTRAGLYGSVLLILPGAAGAYGGFFGQKFMKEVFLAGHDTKK